MKHLFYLLLSICCLNSTLLFSSTTEEYQGDVMLSLLASGANADYMGESISQLDHALQCAHLATLADSDEDIILAALFHDIGHLCPDTEVDFDVGLYVTRNYGANNHESLGANFLRSCGMSEKVCELVLGHVQAKRYLVAVDANYYNKLSFASRRSLHLQGGPMTEAEVEEFESDPLFKLKITMREWDEQAKVPGLEVPGLESYRDMLIRHLETPLLISTPLI